MPWVLVENNKKKSEKKVAKPYKSKYISKTSSEQSSPELVLEKYRPLYQDANHLLSNSLKGVKISSVIDFGYISKKDRKEIADLIHSTVRTLQFFTPKQKLPPLQSELLLKFFTLYDKGIDVFNGVENFNEWLKKPAFGLYNQIPEKLLSTFTGINEVIDELIRIEHRDLA